MTDDDVPYTPAELQEVITRWRDALDEIRDNRYPITQQLLRDLATYATGARETMPLRYTRDCPNCGKPLVEDPDGGPGYPTEVHREIVDYDRCRARARKTPPGP